MIATLAAFSLSTVEAVCRPVLMTLLTALVRLMLPLGVGLSALWAVRRRCVEARRSLANASLMSAAIVLILSLLNAASPTSMPALWRIALPPFHRVEAKVPRTQPSAVESAIEAMSSSIEPNHLRAGADPAALAASAAMGTAAPGVWHGASAVPVMGRLTTRPGTEGHTVAGVINSSWFPIVIAAAVACWSVGMIGLLLWLALSSCTIFRLLRCGNDIEDGPTLTLLEDLCAQHDVCPPRLVACRQVHSPFVAGLWQRTLALPATFRTDFEPDALRAILAHEVMHIVQRDCLWTLLSRVLCAVCWPLPLIWALCRQREALSEEACDAAVLDAGCSPTVYARCLLSLAERLRPLRPERVCGVGALTARSGLGRRIERILTGANEARPSAPRHWRLVLMATATCLALPCMVLVGQAAPKGPVLRGQDVEPAQSTPVSGGANVATKRSETHADKTADLGADLQESAVEDAARQNEHRAIREQARAQETSEARLKEIEARLKAVAAEMRLTPLRLTPLRFKAMAKDDRTRRRLRNEQARLQNAQREQARLQQLDRRNASRYRAQQAGVESVKQQILALQADQAAQQARLMAEQVKEQELAARALQNARDAGAKRAGARDEAGALADQKAAEAELRNNQRDVADLKAAQAELSNAQRDVAAQKAAQAGMRYAEREIEDQRAQAQRAKAMAKLARQSKTVASLQQLEVQLAALRAQEAALSAQIRREAAAQKERERGAKRQSPSH